MENYSFPLPPRRYFNLIFQVHWSVDKIQSLPTYTITKWNIDSNFATFNPSNSVWSGSSERVSSRRNSIRGAVGSNRQRPPISQSLFTKGNDSSTSTESKNNPEEKKETPLPQMIKQDNTSPSLPNGPPPSQTSRINPPVRPPRRGLPVRGRGAPLRARGAPLRRPTPPPRDK